MTVTWRSRPLIGIEQHALLDRVGAPQAGGDQSGRKIERAPVVGAAQAIALERERDVARLAIVVALRLEGGELAVLPLLLGLVDEAEDGDAEDGDDDVHMRAHRQPIAVADELHRLGADVVALADDLVVEAAGGREGCQRHIVAGGGGRQRRASIATYQSEDGCRYTA